jgi:hypothetical protein
VCDREKVRRKLNLCRGSGKTSYSYKKLKTQDHEDVEMLLENSETPVDDKDEDEDDDDLLDL